MSSYPKGTPLIRTKLQPPQLVTDLVPRPSLIERLNSGLDRKLTLVSAPAGYGKTTLAVSWTAQLGRPAVWISLDQGDNDLLLFLRYVVAAVQNLFPNSCVEISKFVEADLHPPVDYLAALLINDVMAVGEPFLLVLDDYHLINDVAIQELVAALIGRQPFNLHLVIITRADPLLPLARLRAIGQTTEIRTPDLRFQGEEAEMFLNRATGTAVERETALALNSQTEGWITGLRLIVLSAPNQEKLAALLLNFQGEPTQFVNEYLVSEVLLHLPESLRAFLLHISILDRLCGPLCEAVINTAAQKGNGHEYLEWLSRANLFVVSLDERQEWYRFHHLFKSFLLKEMESIYSDNEIQELHRRASLWFANQGLVEEAIQYALSAQDFELAVDLVEQQSNNLLNSLERHTLERWLLMLPQEMIWQRPRLMLAQSWLLMREWRLTAMEEALDAAETALKNEPLTEEESEVMLGSIASLRSLSVLFIHRDYKKSVLFAEQALEQLPPATYGARSVALAMFGIAQQALGNMETATERLEATIQSPTQPGPIKIQAFIGLSVVHHASAQLMQMSQVVNRFLTFADQVDNPNAHAPGNKIAGWLSYERNDLDQAAKRFQVTLDYRYQSNFMATFDVSLGLARINLAQGLTVEAQKIVDELRKETLRIKSSDLLEPLEAFQAYLWLVQNELYSALSWARSVTAGEAQETILLSEVTSLTRSAILIAAGTEDEIQEVVNYLETKLRDPKTVHITLRIIQIHIRLALAYDELGNRKNALHELGRALALAEPGGFIRSFTDMGQALLPLLKQLQRDTITPEYLQQIIASFPVLEPSATTEPAAISAVDLLTPRQTEILILLQQGLTYQEIAGRLTVSMNTVRKHVSNIYEKLEVNNRQQAINKAQSLNLIS